ncbi:Phosphatidylglycerol/phosphatidylinositol transfer protein [Phlyctochytrium bullatum]|nr:Phosphatidylglycerol/phosphatidylinositol transfer protein [Phlyctochytrium bullatum]
MPSLSKLVLLTLTFVAASTATPAPAPVPIPAPASAGAVTSCGLPTDLLVLESLSVSPDPPKRGKEVTLKAFGTLAEEVDKGAILKMDSIETVVVLSKRIILETHSVSLYEQAITGIYTDDLHFPCPEQASVKLGPIKLVDVEMDLCEKMESIGKACPLPEGETEIAQTFTIPNEVPPGRYAVHVELLTKERKNIACLNANLRFVLASSSPAFAAEFSRLPDPKPDPTNPLVIPLHAEIPPAAIECVLYFMYTRTYLPPRADLPDSPTGAPPLDTSTLHAPGHDRVPSWGRAPISPTRFMRHDPANASAPSPTPSPLSPHPPTPPTAPAAPIASPLHNVTVPPKRRIPPDALVAAYRLAEEYALEPLKAALAKDLVATLCADTADAMDAAARACGVDLVVGMVMRFREKMGAGGGGLANGRADGGAGAGTRVLAKPAGRGMRAAQHQQQPHHVANASGGGPGPVFSPPSGVLNPGLTRADSNTMMMDGAAPGPTAVAAGPFGYASGGNGGAGGKVVPAVKRSKVQVRVVGARKLNKRDMLTSNDAYVEVWVGNASAKKQKTGVVMSNSPVWNETFTFDITDADSFLAFHVKDKDTNPNPDDGIGYAKFDFEHLKAKKRVSETKELTLKANLLGLDLTPNGYLNVEVVVL